MLALLLMMAQATTGQAAAVEAVATCRAPGDPLERVWSLEPAAPGRWRVVFSSKSLDKPRVELPLADAAPRFAESTISLSFSSANGGRRIEWQIADGAASLDLFVNHGLEVNVERDLDPAVDEMNTNGKIELTCSTSVLRSFDDRSTTDRVSEWAIAAGAAQSVNLYDSTSGRAYGVVAIGWARELTRELRWGPIRGRFAWGVEATPVFAQFEPSAVYGAGFAPVVWRWNFPPQPRWSAFLELSMGGLWTTEPIPEETGSANFSAHWGGGIRFKPRRGHALLVAYRFQHFSNGNQLGSNPGVNSHVVLGGWSYRS
jgi:opacity protein-like surface antigen